MLEKSNHYHPHHKGTRMDPQLISAFSTAASKVADDIAAVTADETGVTPLQAAVTTAQANLDVANTAIATHKTTLQTDFTAMVAAGVALGLSPT
jgi:hypothetical protein